MEKWERRILDWLRERRRRIEQEEREAEELLKEFWREHQHPPRLSKIKIIFKTQQGECAMAPVPGTAILTLAGQVAIASVLGFDQNDNPMPADFAMPPVTFTIDDPAVATLVEDADGETATVAAVANGIANVKASLKTAEGLALSDTEEVEVEITTPPPPPPPTPVLTSIKIAFDVQPPPAPSTEAGSAPEAAATTSAAPLTPNQKLAAALQK